MLKNMKVGKKLGLGFGLLLALMVVLNYYSIQSFGDVQDQTTLVEKATSDAAFLIEKEVDHLKWMSELSELFLDDDVTQVTVQTDDHKCGLGKWLYSDETAQLAAQDPELGKMLDRLKEPHRLLHESASKIDETFIAFDPEVKALLAGRWIDHLNWANDVGHSILVQEHFTGQLNPHECAFGKWYYSYQADNPEFARLLKQWEDPHVHLHESAGEILEAEQSGDYARAKQIYDEETLPALSKLHGAYDNCVAWINDMDAQQKQAHAIFANETSEAVKETQAILGEVKAHFNDTASKTNEMMQADMSAASTLLIALVVVGIIIGLVAAFFITRGITKPIAQITEVADSVAVGDVDHHIELESKDEIGMLAGSFRKLIDYMKELSGAAERIAENDLTMVVEPKGEKDALGNAFKTMSGNLTGMIRQLSENATQLVSAANEIASSSEQMSRGANDQSQQVTQVSSAVEEMSATIVQSSKNAGEATDASKAASDTATTGGQVVNETIQGMQRIASVVRESAESIGKLAKSADQIGEIVGVIDDIADQTNLLALNAAIEAARAGEQGRGFAVVADEVRKLAERTGKATGEITDMIKGIQSETEEAVNSMESGMQQVDKGRELADQAGNSLNEIVAMSQRVMDMIQQIATAAEEQSAAAEQISRNVENVATVTKETASGAEQSAAAAEELNRQAEGLQTMVAQFKLE